MGDRKMGPGERAYVQDNALQAEAHQAWFDALERGALPDEGRYEGQYAAHARADRAFRNALNGRMDIEETQQRIDTLESEIKVLKRNNQGKAIDASLRAEIHRRDAEIIRLLSLSFL